jgi:hypothetical protein
MSVPFKSSPIEFNQHLLFPSHIFDLLKANSSKHKAMSYGRLKEQEAALSAEIDELIEQAARCDQEEDKTYQERTGYELPEDLKHKQGRLAKIKAAKQALEQREELINPGQAIEESKQISFADTESRIMGKKGDSFDYAYNAQTSVDADPTNHCCAAYQPKRQRPTRSRTSPGSVARDH